MTLVLQPRPLFYIGSGKRSGKDSRYKLGVKSALFSRRSLGVVQRGVVKGSGLHARDFLGIVITNHWPDGP